MRYLTLKSLEAALVSLWGTADHMIKIWFVLKQMGLKPGGPPVEITTTSPTNALKTLFSFGDPDGRFYVPFAHRPRFALMQSDASRSIIQTNIRRWQASGSVVQTDPTDYLDISEGENSSLLVKAGRSYPLGLGYGYNGFARGPDLRVSIPEIAFAVWYARQTPIPDKEEPGSFLRDHLRTGLSLTPPEEEAVFGEDESLPLSFQNAPISVAGLNELVKTFIEQPDQYEAQTVAESYDQYATRIRTMVSRTESPSWLRTDPEELVERLLAAGCPALLLYGAPRTGKTRAIDRYCPRTEAKRETIQIHDGWGYDELMISLRPTEEGTWKWLPGVLRRAIDNGKTFIVLEEINRTNFTQALGEAFSLIEPTYRGTENAVRLRDGSTFSIPADTIIVATMNTVDKSTEDVDDALLGRLTAVEFYPRVESLAQMLSEKDFDKHAQRRILELFSTILKYYPLGHGYFADLMPAGDPIDYYVSRVRPVLQSYLQRYRDTDLLNIDNKVDELFAS